METLNPVTLIGFIAAFCTTFALVPQVMKIYQTKKTRDISLIMYSVFTVGLFLWLIYGYARHDIPLFIANFISFALSAGILYKKIKTDGLK